MDFMNNTLTEPKYAASDTYDTIKDLAPCLISKFSLCLKFFRSYNLTEIKSTIVIAVTTQKNIMNLGSLANVCEFLTSRSSPSDLAPNIP